MRVKSLLIVIVIFSAMLVSAQEGGITVTTDDAVNVRSGPGLDYTIRGVLQRDSIPATGRSDFAPTRRCLGVNDLDMWVRVEFNGLEGWVARCAVNIENGSIADLPVATPGNPLRVEDLTSTRTFFTFLREAPDEPFVIGVTRARVNIRQAPSLDAEVIAVTAPLEDFYVIGRTEDSAWVQVELRGDDTGWMASYLLRMPTMWERAVVVR